jgi:hypothetical protein
MKRDGLVAGKVALSFELREQRVPRIDQLQEDLVRLLALAL